MLLVQVADIPLQLLPLSLQPHLLAILHMVNKIAFPEHLLAHLAKQLLPLLLVLRKLRLLRVGIELTDDGVAANPRKTALLGSQVTAPLLALVVALGDWTLTELGIL